MPKELRPVEVLEAYWDSVVAIEEDAEFLEPVYMREEL